MVKLKLNDKGDDWVLLPKGTKLEGSIYLDGILHRSFRDAKEVMKKKSVDLVVVVSGYPGSGKSKFVSQIASFCDPTFNEDRMYQSSREFTDGVMEETEILKAHVLDEAWEGLSSTQVRKEAGKIFMNLMNTIRQKRLFIFIVLPDFFDLSKNIAIFRSRWLFHCYSEHFGDVGRFVAFDRHSKKQLYLKGKQFENYSAYRSDFKGVFTAGDSSRFNWKRYEEEIKIRAIDQAIEKDELMKGSVIQRNRLLLVLNKIFGIRMNKLSELIGLDYKYLCKVVSNEEKSIDLYNLRELLGIKCVAEEG